MSGKHLLGTRHLETMGSSELNSPNLARYKVLYDDQCDICQSFVSWLKLLDRRHCTECLPIDPETLPQIHPSLTLDNCLRELHVVTPDGKVYKGWDAVALLARRFPETWILGALGAVPPFHWLARRLYRFIAKNRYAISKCRGGRCRIARPEEVRKKATFGTFWSCYLIGLLIRSPLVLGAGISQFFHRFFIFVCNFRRRIDLLDGKLSLFFLGGFPCDLVPLFFGEQFVMIFYEGIAIDPGSPKMRTSILKHFQKWSSQKIKSIVATHHHEEHIGNLRWLAQITGASIYTGSETANLLKTPHQLPWIRDFMIGQPPPLDPPFQILTNHLEGQSSVLEIFLSPGHCKDHIVLYDPKEKLLLAGDTFMGIYFSAPNPDVDSHLWLNTLDRLMELDIEILIEGHGHIHTLRPDIPDIPGVVIRQNPKEALKKKQEMMRWIHEQIQSGFQEGLSFNAIEATCFPWNQKRVWENFFNDEIMRVFSGGHFSHSELIKSFVRNPDESEIFPKVYQIQFYKM